MSLIDELQICEDCTLACALLGSEPPCGEDECPLDGCPPEEEVEREFQAATGSDKDYIALLEAEEKRLREMLHIAWQRSGQAWNWPEDAWLEMLGKERTS